MSDTCYSNDSIVYTSLKERQRNDVSSPPLLMLHGHEDDMVNFSWGQTTFKRLQAGGVEGQFIPLSNMEHEITRPVIDKLKPWLTTVLPPI